MTKEELLSLKDESWIVYNHEYYEIGGFINLEENTITFKGSDGSWTLSIDEFAESEELKNYRYSSVQIC